jgi:putative transposase
MTSKPVALLLADLGTTKTHARPHVSNDNPFSEAQFKTLKYRPAFPDRFGSIQDARAHCQVFFPWYNTEHRHRSLGLLTPADVQSWPGRAAHCRAGDRAGRGLRGAPGAFPRRAPPAASVSSGSVDQSTQNARDRGGVLRDCV